LFVQHHHLGGIAEGRVRLDLGHVGAQRRGVANDGFALVDTAGQGGQRVSGVQVGLELGSGIQHGAAAQQRAARAVVWPQPRS
jgi:hypothetical protein